LEDDAVLISRIQAGDREAFRILYERYLPSVWRYVYSQLRGHDAASRDVVSETFLAMAQNIGRLDAASTNVACWLSGVARNKLADYWRRFAPQAAGQDMESPGREIDPVVAMDASEIRQAVGQAMDRLDDPERIALEWKYIDGLTVREIAQRLGRTEKATEGILYRARAAFRAQYQRITKSA
jgi:RNA polymerase sigma-70 factor (ECF subfamily)